MSILALVLALPLQAGASVDLAERYPSSLEPSQPPVAVTWSSGPEHTYRVESFRYADGDRLALDTGPATVTLGANPEGPVWAAVVPDEPAVIAGELAGAGESLRHVFLRFHPAELGTLFPAGALPAGAEAWRFRQGVRVALAKQGNSWAVGGSPMVPPRGTLVLDGTTVEGPRRFYMSQGGGPLEHYDDFVGLRVLDDAPLEAGEGAAAFEQWWSAFDREYAMFGIRAVDWDAVAERFEPAARVARDAGELACVIAAAAQTLDDRHAWVKLDGGIVPNEFKALRYNANFQAVMDELGPMIQPRRGINWGRTGDVGYISVSALDRDDLIGYFDTALEAFADVRGLIVDLRFNSGGNETLAQAMAGRFTDEPRVYATQRYRSGPGRDELGPWSQRVLAPRGEPFELPVVVLTGPAVMSSAEGFALALSACPTVTTLGARTAGSSGNPRVLELAGGITAAVPRWLAADPDHRHFEGRGIAPDVSVDPGADAFETADPVFEAALARLRGDR